MSDQFPAPWTVGNQGWNANIIYDANAEGVCQVYGIFQNRKVEECRNDPGMPVARVIAAAPDLFRELRHLIALLEPLERDGTLAIPGLATLNGARAALVKATEEG